MNLERFFGPGNQLRWAQLAAVPAPPFRSALEPFLKSATKQSSLCVLPRACEGGPGTDWYVGWRDALSSGQVLAFIKAFAGATFANLESRVSAFDLEQGDLVDRAFVEEFGRLSFRFHVLDAHKDQLRQRLQLLLSLYAQAPRNTKGLARPTAPVIRDFELSLIARDFHSTDDILRELREDGHLDALNQTFCELRTASERRDHRSVLRHPGLGSVLEIGVPRRVAQALLASVYAELMFQHVMSGDVDQALTEMRDRLLPAFGVLFRTGNGLTGFPVACLFQLRDEVTGAPARHDAVEVREAEVSPEEWRFWSELKKRERGRAAPPAEATLELAERAFGANDVDLAFSLLAQIPEQEAKAVVLRIRCALEIDSLEAAETALRSYNGLQNPERTAPFDQPRGQRWIAALAERLGLGKSAQNATPSSWEGWFERLRAITPWAAAVHAAERGVDDWDFGILLEDEQAVESVTRTITSTLPNWSSEALRDALPSLTEVLAPFREDSRARPLFQSLFELLATESAMSGPLCSCLANFARPVLANGLRAELYQGVVQACVQSLESVNAASAARAALEILELLVESPCPDQDLRHDAACRIAAFLGRWWHRLDGTTVRLARGLLTECGYAEPTPELDENAAKAADTLWHRFSETFVAFYSLQESAVRRAAKILESLSPTCRTTVFVELDGGSPAMRDAARTADVFVVVTRAAKHAATQAISSNRPRGAPILFARGEGSSSIVSALLEWAASRSVT